MFAHPPQPILPAFRQAFMPITTPCSPETLVRGFPASHHLTRSNCKTPTTIPLFAQIARQKVSRPPQPSRYLESQVRGGSLSHDTTPPLHETQDGGSFLFWQLTPSAARFKCQRHFTPILHLTDTPPLLEHEMRLLPHSKCRT